jgi:hypothetical protein
MFLRNIEGMRPEQVTALRELVAKEQPDAN